MSPRGFLVLLVVTAVAVLGALIAAVQPTLSGTEAVGGDPMFGALAERMGDSQTVAVQTPDYAVSWQYRDGTWVSPEHGDYPGRASAVTELVAGLAALTKVEPKTANPEWYQYVRVGDPAATPPTAAAHVTVSAADGEVLADAILGSRSFSIPASHARGGSFARQADDAQSWLVEGTVAVPAVLPDWFDTIVDIPGPDIASIAILEGGKTVFEARKDDVTSGTYTLVTLDPDAAPAGSVANGNTIRSMAAAIVGVKIEDVRALEGLTVPDTARTDRFTTTAGMQLDVTFLDTDDGVWVLFKASAPEGSDAAATAAAINARTAQWAFRLDGSRLTRLTREVSELVQDPNAPAGGAEALPPGVVAPGGGKPRRCCSPECRRRRPEARGRMRATPASFATLFLASPTEPSLAAPAWPHHRPSPLRRQGPNSRHPLSSI